MLGRALRIVGIGGGSVRCEMRVEERHCNSFGTLHGGCSATLVDVVGTMAHLSLDPARAGVSVEINVSYVSAAPLGCTVFITGATHKLGKRLAFTAVEIRRDSPAGPLVAVGRHTKSLA